MLTIDSRYGSSLGTMQSIAISESETMDPWTALGILLLGAAIGALLTAIACVGRIRQLREDLRAGPHDQQDQQEQDERKGAA